MKRHVIVEDQERPLIWFEPRHESRLTRIGYWIAILAFIGIFLLAWTAVPDCWRAGVCG